MAATHIQYYENESENGSYQYVPLSKIVEDFEFETTDDDSILKNTRRVKIIKHAKDAIRELNKSTFNEHRVMEITVPEDLYVVLPHDYVSGGVVSVVVTDSVTQSPKLLRLNRNTNMNIAKGVLQDHLGDLLFDNEGYVLNTDGSNAYAKPHRTYEYVTNKSDYEKFGEYVIDKPRGRIAFSSDLCGKDIVLVYKTDGLSYDTYGEEEIQVHKNMIQVLKDLMYYTLIRFRRNIPQNEKQAALLRFKTTRHEARLDALNFNLIEVLRKGRNPKQ